MKNIYVFRKYDENYPKIFSLEKKKLIKIIGNAQIEHIGSTSVIGLGGKGVIDIIILVKKKDFEKIRKKIIKSGYEQGYSNEKKRLFFFKQEKNKRFHVHLTADKKIFQHSIIFRELLKIDKEFRKEYLELKKDAIKQCKGIGKIYRELKNDFIKNAIKHGAKRA